MSRHPDLESIYSSLQQTYGWNTFISEEKKGLYIFYLNYIELHVILFTSKLAVLGIETGRLNTVYLPLVNQGHHWYTRLNWPCQLSVFQGKDIWYCITFNLKKPMFWKLEWFCTLSSSLGTYYSITELDQTVIFDLYFSGYKCINFEQGFFFVVGKMFQFTVRVIAVTFWRKPSRRKWRARMTFGW